MFPAVDGEGLGHGSTSHRRQGGWSSRPGPKPVQKSDSGGVVLSSRGNHPKVVPPTTTLQRRLSQVGELPY